MIAVIGHGATDRAGRADQRRTMMNPTMLGIATQGAPNNQDACQVTSGSGTGLRYGRTGRLLYRLSVCSFGLVVSFPIQTQPWKSDRQRQDLVLPIHRLVSPGAATGGRRS